MKLFYVFLLFLSISFSCSSAEKVEIEEWNFEIFVGEGKVENPLIKLDDLKVKVFPSFHFYDEKFFIDNTTIGYNLLEDEQLLIDVVGAVNEDGLFFNFDKHQGYSLVNILGFRPNVGGGKDIDISGFEPIKRDISYLAGINMTFMTDYFSSQVALLNDVTGVHDGNELRVSISKNFILPWFALFIEFGQVKKSKKLVHYYYKFKPQELSFLRDKYEAKEASNRYYKVQLDVPISESFTFVGLVKHTRIADEITDSFLVDKSSYTSSFIGIRYSF